MVAIAGIFMCEDGKRFAAQDNKLRPPPVAGHAMVALHDRIYIIGGKTRNGVTNCVWTLAEGRWMLGDPLGLSGLNGVTAVCDEKRGIIVVVGGWDSLGYPRSETWELDQSVWKTHRKAGPGTRTAHCLSYNSSLGQTVLFGGIGKSGQTLGDTWVWDGNSWSKLSGKGPDARAHAAMAYDESRNTLVLFGGLHRDSSAWYGDTWEWNGYQWEKISTDGPDSRAFHCMAFDRHANRVVLFGGAKSTFEEFGDTWLWNGKIWKEVDNHGPSPRRSHAMTYVPGLTSIVMFGGLSNGQRLDDMWQWDGSNWSIQ